MHYLVGSRAEIGGDPLSPRVLRSLVPGLDEQEAYVCGPAGMTSAAVRALRAAGVPQAAHPLRVVRVLRERIRAMRRVILAVTGTIAGLVALLSFKSHVPSAPVAATTGGSGGTSASSSSSSPSSSGGGQTEVVPGAFPQGSIAKNLPAGETAVDGKVASTAYGPVQIQLIERNSKIVKVAVLVQPTNTLHDVQIGEFAFPKLISETLAAQNGKIDAVSGATYTSAGYIQSLQSALDKRS